MRNRPSTRCPLLRGTRATPYGFTSPFAGMVVLIVVMVFKFAMEDPSAAPVFSFATAMINSARPSTQTRSGSLPFSSIWSPPAMRNTILRDRPQCFHSRSDASLFAGGSCHGFVVMLYLLFGLINELGAGGPHRTLIFNG